MASFITYLALCAAILVLGAKVRRLEERDENKTIILGNMLAGRLDGVERNEDGEMVVLFKDKEDDE